MRPMRLLLLNLILFLPTSGFLWYFRADWYALFAVPTALDAEQIVDVADPAEIPWKRVHFACDSIFDSGYRMEQVDRKRHTRTEKSRFLATNIGGRFLIIQVNPNYDTSKVGGHRFLGKLTWMSGAMASQLKRDAGIDRQTADGARQMKAIQALLDGRSPPAGDDLATPPGPAFGDLALPFFLDTTWSPVPVGLGLGGLSLMALMSFINVARAVRRISLSR